MCVMRTLLRHRQAFAANVADDFNRLLHQLFDSFDFGAFRRIAQRDRYAAEALACCTTDAVNIRFRVKRHIEVDDMRDVVDVNAARRNVGRNQHLNVTFHEVIQGALTRVLRLVAVECDGIDAGHRQTFGNTVRATLGTREHDRTFAGWVSKKGVQAALLFSRADNHHLLVDTIDNAMLGRQVDAERVLQHVVSELLDFRRHRC